MSNEKQREPQQEYCPLCRSERRGQRKLVLPHFRPEDYYTCTHKWHDEAAAPAQPVPPKHEEVDLYCVPDENGWIACPKCRDAIAKEQAAAPSPVLTQPSADDWRLDFLAALELVHAHLMDLSPSESKTADLLMQKHLKVLRVDAERPILPVPPPNIIDIGEQYVLRGELEGLRGWIRAQRELAPERSSSPAVAPTKYKDVCDMLREMATEKPDMRLDVAASVLLGALIPVTQEDIKRGQEIAKELGLASPAVAGRTQGDEPINCETEYAKWQLENNPTAPDKIVWLFNKWKRVALRESAREATSDITSKLRKLEPITACPKCEAETENEAMTECCGNDDCPMDGKWNEALASLNREQIFVEIELREEFPEAPAAPLLMVRYEHPSYKAIESIGKPAVPLLIEDLRHERVDPWSAFSLIRKAGVGPEIPEAHRGRLNEVRADFITWFDATTPAAPKEK